MDITALIDGHSLGSRLQVDEVKVFETFGGDLPVDGSTVKLDSKARGQLRVQKSSMTDDIHSDYVR